MVAETKVVRVEPDSELARRIEAAAERPVRLAPRGAMFSLVPSAGRLPEDRAAVSRAVIEAVAGAWRGHVDTDAFAASIRERRKARNRPSVRW